jgi:hypothetical protein
LSPERRKISFLRAYFSTGSVSFAAAIAGVDRTTPYVWRREDAEFARCFETGRHWPRDRKVDHEIKKRMVAGRMNKRLLLYALRRAEDKEARISTPQRTSGWAKTVVAELVKRL